MKSKKPLPATKKGRGNASSVANWTVLVYLAGDNNLDAAGAVDLREMKSIGSNDHLNVVVQFDRAGKEQSTKRYRLRKGTSVASDVVQDLGETNTGDPEVLYDFLAWGVKTYPAQHYLVSLWNHGAGWDDSNLYNGDYFGGQPPPIVHKGVPVSRSGSAVRGTARAATGAGERRIPLAQARAGLQRARHALFTTTLQRMVHTRAIAFDDQAKDFIDNLEMKRVMLKLERLLKRKIDILGFDACLMSMAEIAYEVREAAMYTVGSQEEEPNNGWPYDRLLGRIATTPTIAPKELARTIVADYLASYRPSDRVTFAACDLSAASAVAKAASELGAALSNAVADPAAYSALSLVRTRVQEYSEPYDEYVDLVDLCDGLDVLVKRPDVAAATKSVRTAVAKLVLESGSKGAAVDRSHGTSIYFPKKQLCSLYANLDFAKDGLWMRFIDDYVKAHGRRGWA